jgi:predicted ATPase
MIESITLRNYRGHVDTTIPCAPFTVLVGENASGKTSVLKAVRWLSEGLGDNLPEFWLHRGANELELTVAGTGSEGAFRAHARYQQKGAGELERAFGEVRHEAGADGLRPHALWLSLRTEELVAPSVPTSVQPELSPSGKGLASVLAYLKLIDDARFSRIVERLRSVVPIVNDIGFARSMVKKTVPRLIQVESRAVELQEQVSAVYDELLFDFVDAPRVPATMVSEGALLVLGLVTALETLDRETPHRPLGGGASAVEHPSDVVLIDDIDRALHPRAQRSLIEALQTLLKQMPGLQIIATSHSPYLADALRPEEVVVLGRNSRGIIAAKRLDAFPDERLRKMLSTGELWMSEGEDWVKQ